MKICAIISEFNPFHNGHKFLIDEIRKKGFTHIVAIMSGNFVQRGEPAIISKNARVKSALMNGIDVVIEIPTIWALSTAEKYAYAGCFIADSLGCIDALAFGSECGNIKVLENIKNVMKSENFKAFLKEGLSQGMTFARARESALIKILSDLNITMHIERPNNILGIEYLKALEKLNSQITPLTIKRCDLTEDYLCASDIRALILNRDDSYIKYVPDSSFKIISDEIDKLKAPCYLGNVDKALMYRIRMMNKTDVLNLPDISEGLENRILNSFKTSFDINELLFKIKTKRYTMSRIKRIILSGFLGITKKIQNSEIPYIRILGLNNCGSDVLKKAKFFSRIPIVSTYAQIKKIGDNALSVFNRECVCSDIYSLFSATVGSCGEEQSFKMIKGEKIDL